MMPTLEDLIANGVMVATASKALYRDESDVFLDWLYRYYPAAYERLYAS